MRYSNLLATMVAVFISAIAARGGVIHFDELPTRPLDGASVNGVTFGYTLGGNPSNDATFNTFIGPGNSTEIHPPNAEGNAAGIVTISFAQPVDHIEFGFALLASSTLSPGVTVSQFAPGNVAAGVTSVDAIILPGEFSPSGHYSYTGAPLQSISLDFNDANVPLFALDDLVFNVASNGGNSVPLPPGVWIGSAMAGALAMTHLRRT